MVNLQENFPKLYQELLDSIVSLTSRALKSKINVIAIHGETERPNVLAYTHDYKKVASDVFRALDLPQYMDRHPEEVARYFDERTVLSFEALCIAIEDALKCDEAIAQRILGLMYNFNYYILGEEFEDCVIQNAPENTEAP